MTTIKEAQEISRALSGSRFVLRVGGFDVPVVITQAEVYGDETAITIKAELTTSGEPSPARVEALKAVTDG